MIEDLLEGIYRVLFFDFRALVIETLEQFLLVDVARAVCTPREVPTNPGELAAQALDTNPQILAVDSKL